MSADGTPPNVLRELMRKGKTALSTKKKRPKKKAVVVLEEEEYVEEIKLELFIGNLHQLQT